MLLIIEVALTIAAWKKGWRGWALLPGGVTLLMGFLLGAMMGAAGVPPENMIGPAVLLDGVFILSLIAMAVWAPKKVQGAAALSAHPTVTRS